MIRGATANEWEILQRSYDLLTTIARQMELCEKVNSAIDLRIGKDEVVNRLFALESKIGRAVSSPTAKSFQREVRQVVGGYNAERSADRHDSYIGIVPTILEYYMATRDIDITPFKDVYNLAMEPLEDFIALSTGTAGDATLQEVALGLLETLKGPEAVTLAYQALYGASNDGGLTNRVADLDAGA